MPKVFPIESNVPLPQTYEIPPLPLDDMAIGESFVVEYDQDTHKQMLRQRLQRFQRSHPPKRFSLRTLNPYTVRIFRVEDYEDNQ